MKKEIEEESIEGSRLRLVKALIKKSLGKLIKKRTLESTIQRLEKSGGTLIVNININDPRLTELIVMENNGQIGGKEEAYG
jgi:hypothetical protein